MYILPYYETDSILQFYACSFDKVAFFVVIVSLMSACISTVIFNVLQCFAYLPRLLQLL